VAVAVPPETDDAGVTPLDSAVVVAAGTYDVAARVSGKRVAIILGPSGQVSR
jgi:hypothetical protein